MRLLLLALALTSAASAQTDADSLLARQLALRVGADQAARGLWTLAYQRGETPTPPDVALVTAVDSLNTAWLKLVVAQRGWPAASRVGERGAHNAWLLAQHADRDRAFQREVLALLETAVAQGEASGSDFAYLTDRVRIGMGELQVYGTQYNVVDGVPVTFQLEDPESVDARRASVGLQSLAEYFEEYLQYMRGESGLEGGAP